MKAVVDTVIWSLALRRAEGSESLAVRRALQALIDEQRVLLLGPIRQELLSGYSDPARFKRLRDQLQGFPNEPILDEDYVRAAEYHNRCRQRGIQGSHTDFLICACAVRLHAAIYTNDKDSARYAAVLPIVPYVPERAADRGA